METVVGMFVNQGQLKFLESQSVSSKTIALKRASEITKTTLYLFSIVDVDLDKKKIHGVYFNQESGLWTRSEFPYPHILYARMGIPKNNREKYMEFLGQLRELGVKTLNGPAFNKWRVLEVLSQNEKLAQHLPKTIPYRSEEDLKEMLQKHRHIYLKACRGRKGQEVMRVRARSKNRYEYRYFRHKELSKGIVSFIGLKKVVNRFFRNKSFILQEAIKLPELDGSICDMRAEVQRTGDGGLDIVEILVRVSRPGAPITQHASSFLCDDFLAEVLGFTYEEIEDFREKVKVFLSEVYQSVEKEYGHYGEIGIDFALDQEGKLWFIECNSRPAKVSLVKAASEETILRSYKHVLEYSKYLHNKQKDS